MEIQIFSESLQETRRQNLRQGRRGRWILLLLQLERPEVLVSHIISHILKIKFLLLLLKFDSVVFLRFSLPI